MPDTALPPDASSLLFAEDLYLRWRHDPQSVSPDWRTYFESLPSDGSEPRPEPASAGPAAGVDAREGEGADDSGVVALEELTARYRGWSISIERRAGRRDAFLARKVAAVA